MTRMPVAIWFLSSLLAIATLGDWDLAGLVVAVLGGVATALASALEATRRPPVGDASPGRVVFPPFLERTIRWIVRNELWILLLTSPLFLFPRHVFVLAFLIVPFLWILRWRVRGQLTRRTPLDLPILLIMTMLPIGLVVSVDLEASFSKLAGIVLGIGVFYAIVNLLDSERKDFWIVTGVIAIEIAIGFAGLLGTKWFAAGKFLPAQLFALLPHVESFPGATEGLFHPNQIAGTQTFIVPFLGVLILGRWGAGFSPLERGLISRVLPVFLRYGLWIALTFTSFVLLLTQSRSALFSVGVSLLALGIIRWRLFRWALAPIVISLMLFVFFRGTTSLSQLVSEPEGASSPVGTLYFAGRVEVWQHALYAIQDFPFTGIGLATFGPVSRILYPYFLLPPEFILYHAHDMYLQVALDLGVPGLVAYIALLAAFGYCVVKVYASSASPSARTIALALGLGVLAHQIFGLTDAVVLGAKQGIILWVMLALGASLWQRTQNA